MLYQFIEVASCEISAADATLAEEGLAYVQSLSSMIPAAVLSPKEGEAVLDMCAAPGSKTTQMAEIMKNSGSIDAWDLYPHKISLIKNNAKKLGISITLIPPARSNGAE